MSEAINHASVEMEMDELRRLVQAAHTNLVAGKDVDLSTINAMVEALTNKLQAHVFSFTEPDRIAVVSGLTDLVADFGALENVIVEPNVPSPPKDAE